MRRMDVDDIIDLDKDSPKLEIVPLYPNIENYANQNYSGEIILNFCLSDINKITENDTITSDIFYIRNVPVFLEIEQKVKKSDIKNNNNEPKRIKVDRLNFKLKMAEQCEDDWRCKFQIHLNFAEIDEVAYKHTVGKILKNACNSVSIDIDCSLFENNDKLNATMSVKAELPNYWSSIESTGFIGLRNEGATCYINALFQSLFSINKFRQIVFDAPIDPDDIHDSFVFDLKYIFYMMQEKKCSEIRMLNFIKHFEWDQMTRSNQQDVEEFLRLLTDKLNANLGEQKLINDLNDLFVGQIKTITECPGFNSPNVETFWDIQLAIDEYNNINEAFDAYVAPQEIKE